MSFFEILDYMLVLVILFLVGVVARRTGVTDELAEKNMSKLILTLSQSASILYSAMTAESTLRLPGLFKILALAFLAYGIIIVVGMLVPRALRAKRQDYGLYQFMSIFSNVGFMGYPIISSLYGAEAIFYTAMFSLPFNILAYTYGIALVSGGEGQQKIQWKSIINSPTVCSLLAACIVMLRIKFPDPVVTAANTLGSTLTPLAMLIIGGSMANMRIRDILGDWRVYVMTVIRLFVIPVLIWAIMRNFLSDPMLLGVCTLIFAMPTAAIATIFSIQYHGNVELASKTVFLSTVFSVVSIPLIISTLLI